MIFLKSSAVTHLSKKLPFYKIVTLQAIFLIFRLNARILRCRWLAHLVVFFDEVAHDGKKANVKDELVGE